MRLQMLAPWIRLPTFFKFPSTLFFIIFVFCTGVRPSSAQTPLNGQIFTNGLAIINSPQLNTQFSSGSPIPISIEVSGNGKLPLQALNPGSGLPTRYDSLDIYLVSSQMNINMTVSVGPSLFTGESGSVRRLNWPIPFCVPSGQYDLTFYEASHINDQGFFTITQIPVTVSNNNPSGDCSTQFNPLGALPQASDPFPQSPFLPGQQSNLNTVSVPTPARTSSGMLTSVTGTGGKTPDSSVVTITLSGDGSFVLPTVTVAPTGVPTTVTLVIVSVTTVTTAPTGQEGLVTSTYTTTRTTTAVMGTQDNSGFLPVNSSSNLHPQFLFVIWMLIFSRFIFAHV